MARSIQSTAIERSDALYRVQLYQDDHNPKSLCKRSLFYRPLPQGRRIYLVLFQLVLLANLRAVNDLFFQGFVVKYCGSHHALTFISFASFPLLLCLPMGFIADRYFGRAKVMYYSWIFLSIAQLMFVLHSVIAPYSKIAAISIAIFGLLIAAISLAGIWVNIIPFGVDQMRTASSEELSSFFHWHYWCWNLGVLFAFSFGGYIVELKGKTSFLPYSVSFAVAILGTTINIVGYNWFIKREKVGNPLLLIYRVLRYAVTAKKPAERSAFSFDDRPEPSKIDLAKQTHYGIFRDEQVEDVKTFLRILVFIALLFGYLCVLSLLGNLYIDQSVYFQQPSSFSHDHQLNDSNCKNISKCANHLNNNSTITIHELHGPYALYWVLLINIATVLLLIPILDRAVYPFWFLWIPNMFNRIGSGLVTSFTGIACALAVEVVRISRSNTALQINSFLDIIVFSVDIPVWVLAPQFLIQALAECLVYITMLEFIYAQSPAYMKSLLLGFLFFTEGVAYMLGSVLFWSQSKGKSVYWQYLRQIASKEHDKEWYCACVDTGSCLPAYTIIALVTIIAGILFLYFARKYKIRTRGNALRYFL